MREDLYWTYIILLMQSSVFCSESYIEARLYCFQVSVVIHFLDGSLLCMPWGIVWKVKGQERVYSNDLKLQGSWNSENNIIFA